MDSIQKLHTLVQGASCITIAVHTHPDGDAIGSGSAMMRYLVDCHGKDAVLVLPDPAPDSLAFMIEGIEEGRIMAFSEDPVNVSARIASSDLVFCLDCNSFKRTAGAEESLRKSTAPKILIDHHLNPEEEAFDLVISKTEISSASEVLFWTLKQMPGIDGDITRLPMACISAITTGMTTDTNNFANSVFPSTLEMASELISAGVDRAGILAHLYNSYRENRLRLMGYMLSEKMTITKEGVAYMILDQETKDRFDFREGESEGFVNLPLAIERVRMSILLTIDEGRFRTSVRSKVGTSANNFATQWCNGGGHELAAGGKIRIPEDISAPDEAEAYILKAISQFFKQ